MENKEIIIKILKTIKTELDKDVMDIELLHSCEELLVSLVGEESTLELVMGIK